MPDKRRRFSIPTTIEYGPSAMKDLVNIIKDKGLTRGLLVTDQGIEKVGTAETLRTYFKTADIDIATYSGVKSNPTDDNCYEGAQVYKDSKAQFIVGLGGGSPLDTAKVIKCLATHDGPLEKYDDMKGGSEHIKNNMPPFYAIPTTAGTGSEVGRSGVITIKSTSKKTIIFSPFFMPDIAVLDPEVTVSLPPHLTASTGIDAFIHNLEAYLVDTFNPFCDGIAREGIYRCFKYLPRAFKNGNDIKARGELLMASSMGATAFQKGLGIVHSLAHALGAMFDLHHGLANAAVLMASLRYNLDGICVRQKLASIGPLLKTESSAEAVINTIEKWITQMNISTDLKEYNIPSDRLTEIEEYAFGDPCLPTNPRPPKKGEITDLLKEII